MSLFITFEGGEGSGKSFQSRALHRTLRRIEKASILTREPGGTVAGEKIAHWLRWAHSAGISPLSELLMFSASRAQLVEELIKPALAEGTVVICDRFADSSLAYQGYGRGLELEMIKSLNLIATSGLKPNLTIMLDIAPEIGLARKEEGKQDRFHLEEINFHQRVRQGYLQLAAEEPERWLVIDATLPKEKIRNIIWNRVLPLLSAGGAF